MKLRISFYGILLSVIMLVSACGGSNDSSDSESDESDNVASNVFVGTLVSVDDTGIPYLLNLTINTDNGTKNLNYEGEYSDLEQFIGKDVEVEFEKQIVQTPVDILYDGNSLYGEYGAVASNGGIDPNWEAITGEFYADEASGDTPSEFSILADNGDEYYFQAFIDESMLEYNYFQVTVYTRTDEFLNAKSIQIK